ncbi:MAG: hypothetical protein ABR508_11670 [Candidatus Baltobacteraceae bacterium]
MALIILAAFLDKSFAFHMTMAPGGLPPFVVLALDVVALKYRSNVAQLACHKKTVRSGASAGIPRRDAAVSLNTATRSRSKLQAEPSEEVNMPAEFH